MSGDELKQKVVAIKKAISEGKKAEYNGVEYNPTALILRNIKGDWLYSVELQSIKARSITIARVSDVEVVNGEQRGKAT